MDVLSNSHTQLLSLNNMQIHKLYSVPAFKQNKFSHKRANKLNWSKFRLRNMQYKSVYTVIQTQVNSALHPSRVAKSSTSIAGRVTSAWWQVTLCDPIWHVISHSSEVISTNWYIHLTLLTYTHTSDKSHFPNTNQVLETIWVLIRSQVCIWADNRLFQA